MASEDIFDDVFLNLEEEYYREGYEQGHKDGAEAGRIEGRSVGLKSGYEKFLEAGRLQGKAIVWANRIPGFQGQGPIAAAAGSSQQESQSPETGATGLQGESSESAQESKLPQSESQPQPQSSLPPINSNLRLEKNITTLYALMEPGTLSTKNEDEAVNDFDSRMKGAQSKLKLIERVIGEGTGKGNAEAVPRSSEKNENIEDVGRIRQSAGATQENG